MNTNKLRLFTRLFTLLSLLFLVTSAQADNYWNPGSESSYSPVRIDVVDDSGRILNTYSANSRGYQTQRTYLEAIKGKRYKLRIRNTSNRRIGVVVAVDGRNILSGKKSFLRNNEKMYVLDPHETANYKGWRTSKNRVNRFYFTSAGDSYSNAWGDRSALGVIAVAVYDEKRRHYYKKHRKGLSNRSAPSNRGYLADESTGTGFGREEYSPTINVRFKANGKPSFRHFFKYEWKNTLCKRGIGNCGYYENRRDNNRFWPKEAHNPRNYNNGYAKYPPNYRLKDWDEVTGNWEDIVIRDRDFGNNRNW